MKTFDNAFNEYMKLCYPQVAVEDAIEIRRVFYAGALEVLNLLSNTTDDNEEQEVMQINTEINNWCAKEVENIKREIEIRKRSN